MLFITNLVLTRACWERGGHALFLLTLQTDTLRELFGESRESFTMYVIAK